VPKIKTHKATAKRLKVTGTGKIMRLRARRSHLRRRRAKRVRRTFDRSIEVESAGAQRRIKRLAPYLD
jgi:large subunit ribosomal protein L35